MSTRRIVVVFPILACIVLAGCATSRSEIRLNAPASPPAASVQSTGKIAVIRTVKDERRFELAPREPSIPSLGFEGAAQATADVKLRAIGRKRNTYGMALGDVLLQGGQTVESVIRENLSAVLRESGYQVTEPAAGQSPALVLDVHIKQFWSWLNPGFWAITANANIETDLEIAGRADAARVFVHFQDARQFVTDAAWVEVVELALQAYRIEAAQKLAAPQ